ncbi:hypothetical protein MXD60_13975, partial [Frankia sp. AgB32]|nr:hypothetical protein [Frankia sp. AgB32]
MTWPPDRPERHGPPPADRGGRGEGSPGARRDPRRGASPENWPAGQWQRRDPGAPPAGGAGGGAPRAPRPRPPG